MAGYAVGRRAIAGRTEIVFMVAPGSFSARTRALRGARGACLRVSCNRDVIMRPSHERRSEKSPDSKKDPSPLLPLPIGWGEGENFLRATHYKHGATSIAR